MPSQSLVTSIIEEFGLPESPRDSTIPKQKVLEWMGADDLEALGALYSFVTKPEYAERIRPPLTYADYWAFIAKYFAACLRENPDGEWSHGRYDAGWDLARWFGTIWEDSTVPENAKGQIREWLATQYRQGDAATKRAIVDATLEHLFENRKIARFFGDWKDDPELSIAFKEASEWVDKGGRTELLKKT